MYSKTQSYKFGFEEFRKYFPIGTSERDIECALILDYEDYPYDNIPELFKARVKGTFELILRNLADDDKSLHIYGKGEDSPERLKITEQFEDLALAEKYYFEDNIKASAKIVWEWYK